LIYACIQPNADRGVAQKPPRNFHTYWGDNWSGSEAAGTRVYKISKGANDSWVRGYNTGVIPTTCQALAQKRHSIMYSNPLLYNRIANRPMRGHESSHLSVICIRDNIRGQLRPVVAESVVVLWGPLNPRSLNSVTGGDTSTGSEGELKCELKGRAGAMTKVLDRGYERSS
jgi:hypothetical protein